MPFVREKEALLLKKGVDKRKKISFISLHLVFIKEKWISFNSKHTDLDTLSNWHSSNPSKFWKNKDFYLNQVQFKQEKERNAEENIKLLQKFCQG